MTLSVCVQGSTVNMNVIGWVYGRIEAMLGSAGHTTLGITLMIGESPLTLLMNPRRYQRIFTR